MDPSETEPDGTRKDVPPGQKVPPDLPASDPDGTSTIEPAAADHPAWPDRPDPGDGNPINVVVAVIVSTHLITQSVPVTAIAGCAALLLIILGHPRG